MNHTKSVLAASLVTAVVGSLVGLGVPATASAQNPNFPGYLGVYVVEGNGGMRITNFIRNTPAEGLALQGDIRRNDVIVKLGGRPTRTLQQLREARNRIPDGQEAKMVLYSGGQAYYVWIARSEAVAAAMEPGSPAPRMQAPGGDRFYKGGRGEGTEGDFRDARGAGGGGDDRGPSGRGPGGGRNPGSSGPSGGDGDFRDKK